MGIIYLAGWLVGVTGCLLCIIIDTYSQYINVAVPSARSFCECVLCILVTLQYFLPPPSFVAVASYFHTRLVLNA